MRWVVSIAISLSLVATAGLALSRDGRADASDEVAPAARRPQSVVVADHVRVPGANGQVKESTRSHRTPARPLPAEFQDLLRRSIFSPRPVTPPGGGKNNSAQARPPAADLVVRGVSSQLGEFVALLEDQAERRVRRVRAGDAVAGGRVNRVGFEGVEYAAGGRTLIVPIGSDLTGTAAAAPPAGRSPGDGARAGDKKSVAWKRVPSDNTNTPGPRTRPDVPPGKDPRPAADGASGEPPVEKIRKKAEAGQDEPLTDK